MYIDLSSINFILVIVAVFWLLVISVFAISLLMGDRSDQKISKGFEHLRQDLESKTQALLDAVNKDTHHLVSDAMVRSESMENDTRKILGENHTQFTQELQKLSAAQLELLRKSSEDLSQTYKAAISHEKEEILNNFHKTSEDLRNTLLMDFDKFKQDLSSKTLEVQKQLDTKSEETYKKVKEELESYKQERINKLEDNILIVLQDVATKAFGKVISLQDHKEFVLRALEQSKKENGLKK